jgi:hypothetical protein
MTRFGAAGRENWMAEPSGRTLMDPDAFISVHFARVAGDINMLLCLMGEHDEMPEFIRQLAAVVRSGPSDDPPAAGVPSRLPGDGSPPPGSLYDRFLRLGAWPWWKQRSSKRKPANPTRL